MHQLGPAQDEDGARDVFGQDLALQQGSLCVELAQLVLLDAVDLGALRAPTTGKDTRTSHDTVGIDPVHPNTVLTEFGGAQSHLVCLVRLRRTVGDVVGPGEYRVLARDVDDVATHGLGHHHLRCGLAHQKRTARHHGLLAVPVFDRCVLEALGDREARVVHHEIDATVGEHALVDGVHDLFGRGHVHADRDGPVAAAEFLGYQLRTFEITVGNDHARAFGAQSARRRGANSRAAAGHERDARRQGLGRRHPAKLLLFEFPVLDAELLLLGDGGVG